VQRQDALDREIQLLDVLDEVYVVAVRRSRRRSVGRQRRVGVRLFLAAPVSGFPPGRKRGRHAPDHDVVAVVRWIERGAIDQFIKRLLAAVG
jgi:hypothetical protein